MPSVTAKRRCPDLVFVKPRFDAYREVSHRIRAIFAEYTPLVEPLSLDEAYLDVTHDLKGIGVATRIAEEIRARIRAETELTARAGVSYNKFLAKLASDQNKPDGLCVITPARGLAFVAGLPVRRFHGVGPRTAEKMARLGIETGADLRAQSLAFLTHHLGSWANIFSNLARAVSTGRGGGPAPNEVRGGDHLPRRPRGGGPPGAPGARGGRPRRRAAVEERSILGRTVTLKVKYKDFRICTRARSLDRPVAGREEFLDIGVTLLRTVLPTRLGIRLLGLTLVGLSEGEMAAGPVELELPLPLPLPAPAA